VRKKSSTCDRGRAPSRSRVPYRLALPMRSAPCSSASRTNRWLFDFGGRRIRDHDHTGATTSRAFFVVRSLLRLFEVHGAFPGRHSARDSAAAIASFSTDLEPGLRSVRGNAIWHKQLFDLTNPIPCNFGIKYCARPLIGLPPLNLPVCILQVLDHLPRDLVLLLLGERPAHAADETYALSQWQVLIVKGCSKLHRREGDSAP
jgi:hypothetical protein